MAFGLADNRMGESHPVIRFYLLHLICPHLFPFHGVSIN